MMSNEEYTKGVLNHVYQKMPEYVFMFAGLSNVKLPSPEVVGEYLSEYGELTVIRDAFHVVEGCTKAIDIVVNAKLNYYPPCMNMIQDINKALYDDYKWNQAKAFDSLAISQIITETAWTKAIYATSTDELFSSIIPIMDKKIFVKFNITTVVLFVEAILLYKFGLVWDITTASVSEMKQMIALARTGEPEKLFYHYKTHLIDLSKE